MNKLEISYPIIRKATTPANHVVNFDTLQSGIISGLVLRLKSDRKPDSKIARVEIYADMTKIRVPQVDLGHPPPKRGIRQPIKEFTRTSRRAMLNALSQMREVGQGYLITLTFPGIIHVPAKFVATKENCKNALASFRKRLARKLPKCGGVWRLEPKTRLSGASIDRVVPHYHLLLFGVDWTDPDETLIEWVSRSWNEIINPDDPKHRQAGTQVKRIWDRRHAMSYASKYTAKADDEFPGESVGLWGRRWGIFGNINREAILIIQVPTEQLIPMRRLIRRFLQARSFAAWQYHWNNTKTVGLPAVRPSKNRYAERLRRVPPNGGFSILGLGDLSSDHWQNIMQSTVYKMFAPLSEMVCKGV